MGKWKIQKYGTGLWSVCWGSTYYWFPSGAEAIAAFAAGGR